MASHVFGHRMRLLRWDIEKIPRIQFANRLSTRGQRQLQKNPGDHVAWQLAAITGDDVRSWERELKEPISSVKRRIAQILGYRHELLDPSTPDQGLAPEKFLISARGKNLGPVEITHAWKVATAQGLFKGGGPEEWGKIIEQFGMTPSGRQLELFRFWCTHCGFQDTGAHVACPMCGDVE